MTEVKKGTLTILRHGETVYNENDLITGHHDAPLTYKGIKQAETAGKILKGHVFDHVYSSTLSRAFNTASIILEHTGSNSHLMNKDGSWKIDPRVEIIETNQGIFMGRNKRTDPDVLAHPRESGIPYPGGESHRDVVMRVREFFNAEVLPRLNRGENVLIACHAGIVRAFDRVLDTANIPDGAANDKSVPIQNAAPTIFSFENGKPVSMKRLPLLEIKK